MAFCELSSKHSKGAFGICAFVFFVSFIFKSKAAGLAVVKGKTDAKNYVLYLINSINSPVLFSNLSHPHWED